ncbi:PA2169 family four-helix-bundle protein [Pseudoxanthomonas composti]|uniref:PA2169 family four-helix-bundle protein n=1 Tax=Pseudoxanthomonas composti TaxID=2137479 RepID=A0A4Q1JT34_9GAMM|nr:PA2169 family four-helix-bundle protein [Pseudoxanthomonas composti]RXR03448.1 PA2169 family four-helix-bundle protein [Pseudoxanthomonas composti]
MSTASKTAHSLNDLIQIARDGQDFYTDAAPKVKDAELAQLFNKIAATKQNIVDQLSRVVAANGKEPAQHGTLVGSLQEFYGKTRAALGDTQYGYVAELEESEDRLLKAFRETVADADTTPEARRAIETLMPDVVQTHGIMRDRKLAMKRAA